jgi:hypothetical protein
MLALVRLVRNQKSTDLRWSEKVQEHRWRSAMVGEEHQSTAQEIARVHGRRRQPSLFGTNMPRRAQGPDNIQTCVTASGTLMYGTAAAGWKHLKGYHRGGEGGGGAAAVFRLVSGLARRLPAATMDDFP